MHVAGRFFKKRRDKLVARKTVTLNSSANHYSCCLLRSVFSWTIYVIGYWNSNSFFYFSLYRVSLSISFYLSQLWVVAIIYREWIDAVLLVLYHKDAFKIYILCQPSFCPRHVIQSAVRDMLVRTDSTNLSISIYYMILYISPLSLYLYFYILYPRYIYYFLDSLFTFHFILDYLVSISLYITEIVISTLCQISRGCYISIYYSLSIYIYMDDPESPYLFSGRFIYFSFYNKSWAFFSYLIVIFIYFRNFVSWSWLSISIKYSFWANVPDFTVTFLWTLRMNYATYISLYLYSMNQSLFVATHVIKSDNRIRLVIRSE